MTPTLRTTVSSLHLAGRRSPEASLLPSVQTCLSRFVAAGSSPAWVGRLQSGKAGPVARAW